MDTQQARKLLANKAAVRTGAFPPGILIGLHWGVPGMLIGATAAFATSLIVPELASGETQQPVLAPALIPIRLSSMQDGPVAQRSKRSIQDRLLGRFPDEEAGKDEIGIPVSPKMPRSSHFPRPMPQEEEPSYPADLKEEDLSLSQFDPPLKETPLLERGGLDIAESFRPSATSFCGQCVSICGMRRKGKSNLLTVLAEELAKQRPTPPILLLDTEDEYGPLAHPDSFPRGIAAGAREGAADVAPGVEKYVVVSRANAEKFGRAIVEQRLQVVLNLKSYSDEDACFIMAGIIKGIDDWQQAQREDAGESRIPVFAFMDEAAKWMPQNQGEMRISPAAKAALYQSFYNTIVRMGGKRGWNLIAAFQKLADIDNRLLQASYKFIFGQSELADLKRAKEMGLDSEAVKALRPGECFAFCPQREGAIRIQVRRCHSYHVGSTPSFENLLHGEERVVRNLDGVLARFAEAESEEAPRYTLRTFPASARPDAPAPVPAGRHTETTVERELRRREEWQRQGQAPVHEPVAFPSPEALRRPSRADLQKNHILMTALQYYQNGFTKCRDLGEAMGVSHGTAARYIEILRTMGEIA